MRNENQIFAQENASATGQAGQTLWAITDNNGSVVDVVGNNGGGNTILNHIVYDSFGNTVSQTNSADALLMGFDGYIQDSITGLYYANARFYSSQMGRFINQDPSGFAAGDSNLYRFVGNHPTYATDPTGLYEGGTTYSGGLTQYTNGSGVTTDVGTAPTSLTGGGGYSNNSFASTGGPISGPTAGPITFALPSQNSSLPTSSPIGGYGGNLGNSAAFTLPTQNSSLPASLSGGGYGLASYAMNSVGIGGAMSPSAMGLNFSTDGQIFNPQPQMAVSLGSSASLDIAVAMHNQDVQNALNGTLPANMISGPWGFQPVELSTQHMASSGAYFAAGSAPLLGPAAALAGLARTAMVINTVNASLGTIAAVQSGVNGMSELANGQTAPGVVDLATAATAGVGSALLYREPDPFATGSFSVDNNTTNIAPVSYGTTAATENVAGQSTSLWTRSEVNGVTVYQRSDLINQDRLDIYGRTNLQRMQDGYAPIGPDGKPINLHHILQTNDSSLAEMTTTFHQQNSNIIHINDNSIPSGINRTAFNIWRNNYWMQRANNFASGVQP